MKKSPNPRLSFPMIVYNDEVGHYEGIDFENIMVNLKSKINETETRLLDANSDPNIDLKYLDSLRQMRFSYEVGNLEYAVGKYIEISMAFTSSPDLLCPKCKEAAKDLSFGLGCAECFSRVKNKL